VSTCGEGTGAAKGHMRWGREHSNRGGAVSTQPADEEEESR
jgi:hypothetical protein